MSVSASFRDRLRGDRIFRERFMDEILIQIADKLGIIDENGEFQDPNSGVVQSPIDVSIAGKPVHHYYGLSLAQIRTMGLSEADIDLLRVYINPQEEDTEIHVEAPAQDEAGVAGTEHPLAQAWKTNPVPRTDEKDPPADA